MPSRHLTRQEIHFKVLHTLQENPHLSQRELAARLGFSLAKTNYLINALVEKGHLKIESFRRSGDKLNKIAYLLTPEGIMNRMALTSEYLERKRQEFDALKAEIERLQTELSTHVTNGKSTKPKRP
jgi:EPS-associated MarR family transcriptional regulator